MTRKRALIEMAGDLLFYMPQRKTRLIHLANLNNRIFDKLIVLMPKLVIVTIIKKQKWFFRTPEGQKFLDNYLFLISTLGVRIIDIREAKPF